MNKNTNQKGVSGRILMREPLRQFLIVREGLQPDQPLLIVPGKSPIKIFLDSLLTNKTSIREDKRSRISEVYDCGLDFVITEGVAEWGELFMTPTRVIRFNSFVRQLMIDTLVFQTISNKKRGIKEKQTIYEFIEDYQLYMINFDALKKATLRYRNIKELEKFSSRKCPAFPQSLRAS